MYLITYESVSKDNKQKGYSLEKNIFDFIMETQKYPETYYILNVIKLTKEQYKYIDKNTINGM